MTTHPTLLFLLPLLATSLLLQFHHDHASADCEPAACGDLTLRYPFWLGSSSANDTHHDTPSPSPPPCAHHHPGFEVWCSDDGRVASLKGTYIHVLSINYSAGSLVASHARIAGAGGVCQADFNVSSSIALSVFTFSPRKNRALCFLYACNGTAPPSGPGTGYANATSSCAAPVYAFLADGDFYWDRPPAVAAGACKYSYVPVLGSEAAVMTAANYSRLLKDGFVLNWEVAGVADCQDCNASAEQCRHGNRSAAAGSTCAGE